MFGFSKKKKNTHKELEELVEVMKLNASNNYRDATVLNLKELAARYEELKEAGKLNEAQTEHYATLIEQYGASFKHFTHRDQKAGW